MLSKALSRALVAGAMLLASSHGVAEAQTIPGRTGTPTAAVELWRMQCGKDQQLPKAMFSDTFLYPDASSKDFTFSCYLIRKRGQQAALR